MKTETLEEASKRYSYGGREGGHRTPFLEGVKWQQERSYSDENMRKAFCAGFASNVTSSINDAFEKWFEQFNKKQTMKTAMEQLIYELEVDGYQFDNNILEKYVEKEKQQIIEAYSAGEIRPYNGIKYYDSTFGDSNEAGI